MFEGDGLPDKICHPCRYQLEKSYTFRKKCENSDLKLRQHLKNLQEKLGEVVLTEIVEDRRGNLMCKGQEDVGGVSNEEIAMDVNTEEDLEGIAQVTYIEPDPEPEEDPENITLPQETDKYACTLDTVPLKKEVSQLNFY